MTGDGDVAVVGAGLIGLAIAFELSQRGACVRVYDRAEPAKAASWAGAGMLAPYTEDLKDVAMRELCLQSLALYPSFCARVASAAGVDPHLRLDGIVETAFDARAWSALQHRADRLRDDGVDCQLLRRSEALAAEPWLGGELCGALLIRGQGHVDNRRLGRALTAACVNAGVTFDSGAPVEVECDRRRALGVRNDVGFRPAGAVVNACGAWAASLPGVPPRATPPVTPVKGQMVALQAPVGLVRRSTWLRGAYVVPRDDGRLLIGASVEPGISDVRVTAGAVSDLLGALVRDAPSLRGFSLVETWAGVRPGSPDGRPFLGPTPIAGLYLAAGHYRNGILLAPVTAVLLASCLEGRRCDELPAFALSRMETSANGANVAACEPP